ncbi:16S rRNA (guanine(527)-N(7))-methyltransferase RsmG [Segniliparus rugosus]|uniref:Ribosomal RNA small subunit methyltransferase G n=1 Tax=Segniliparus rugosus (strain ATCC BAA-974 / DSM 45345 / CCUG 50838 / CIP 108380 / JCM 13579 / CDC 945) TaxID=679197 RepID=E5XV90_SEGRC|nr:16S rRNA (guanine(527)-N(7))-methyltransferase RsmG [Segniliparus rugosus]EFV11703.1 16S rRNA (guanine(527)-N(7))-methyltransferase GidB [Segniliparus rugosus ATCC BAA-974]
MTDLPSQEMLEALFGDRAHLAIAYAEWLADVGVAAGLIGPREAERLWERHILNSAAVVELIPEGAQAADLGSGAGLPGIPIAIARPDVRMTLVEPLARRVDPVQKFLEDVGLDVGVLRARAESSEARELLAPVPVVVSRAVAALDTLARWSNPLLPVGGLLLAVKGKTAQDELSRTSRSLRDEGFDEGEIKTCGKDGADEGPKTEATVVVLRKVASPSGRRRTRD